MGSLRRIAQKIPQFSALGYIYVSPLLKNKTNKPSAASLSPEETDRPSQKLTNCTVASASIGSPDPKVVLAEDQFSPQPEKCAVSKNP